ncbi:MAG: HIT family protein [Promethearchaeota archaeon]|jgi:ATP adenylyltransferase
MVFKDWLQALGKLDYVQGKARPEVDCIFCAVRDNDERVETLKVYEDDLCFIVLNLYPYNPAHLLIVTQRHITKFLELTKEEMLHISRVIQGVQMLINYLYNPKGYNIGLNQGRDAGGSIDHLHVHIVPRYGSELGFIDIVGKTRVLPEGLDAVKKKIKENIENFLNNNFFENY